MVREQFKLEVKTAAMLVFMGVGAVASGVGCLTGAIRVLEDIASGEIQIWDEEKQEVYYE